MTPPKSLRPIRTGPAAIACGIIACSMLPAQATPDARPAKQEPPWQLAKQGRLDELRQRLQATPDLVHSSDDDKRTPLHLAARYGHLDIAQFLIAKGANIDAKAYNRFTPLQLAVTFGKAKVVKALLARAPDLEAVTSFGRSALQLAAADDREDLVQMLLDRGARYDAFTAACRGDLAQVRAALAAPNAAVDRATILQAIRRGHAEIVTVMLPKLRAQRIGLNPTTVPLLLEATAHVAVVRAMVAAGKDPDERSGTPPMGRPTAESSALHMAAARDHDATVAYLLTLDPFANPDVHNARRETPAHLAAHSGSLTSLKMLHQKGASLTAKTPKGRTCVHYAAEQGRVEVLEWLTRQGVVPHDHDQSGRSPLSLATRAIHPTEKRREERIEAAWILVRHGVPVDIRSAITIGDAASAKALLESKPRLIKTEGLLVRALSFGRRDIVQLLLDKGCDPNALDGRRSNALHWAALWRQGPCAELLLARGTDPNARDKFGKTPLHEAARANCLAVAKALLAAGAKRDIVDKEGKLPHRHLTARSPEVLRELLQLDK